jgi:phosphonate ABC transporter permease subunit PhnE
MNNERQPRQRLLRNFLLGVILFLVYAYAVQVVNIDLRVPQEPRRQQNLINLLRQMARPDIFAYNFETQRNTISLRVPCPEVARGSQLSYDGRTITLSPNCADTTQDPLTFTGEGFPPHTRGVLRWYPPGEGITPRALANIRADAEGRFSIRFTMPDVRASDEPQRIELEEILDSNISGLSEASRLTWERILETILMALMASTLATIVAIPLSFIAARNLMVGVKAPLAAIMAAVTAVPLGTFLASLVSQPLVSLSAAVTNQAALLALGATVVASALVWPVLRLGPPVNTESDQPPATRVFSWARILLALLLLLLSVVLLSHLGLLAGRWLAPRLGAVRFLGTFVVVMSDLVRVMFPTFLALMAVLVALSLGSRYGEEAMSRLPETPARLLTAVLTATGTAVFIYGVGSLLNWLYQFENPQYWTTIPALVGAVVLGLAALAVPPRRPFAIGLALYAVTRGTLNLLRAIEPLILSIIFVAWVGLGPFAGILALTLNSIADLGKLFSEQVENIDQGPIEAITATGAGRLPMIVYAVIPQIVPPFIAFAFYRWDINVRLSTIIGLVGGGGIGVILLRYANLLQYRQAAVTIIAIALVVGLLDYVSSELRKRLI